MNEEYALLCRKYATAFLNVNGDQLSIDDCKNLKKAEIVLQAHRSWLVFFDLPDLGDKKREQMIVILLKQLHMPGILKSLLMLLDIHRRIWLLPEIISILVSLFFERNNLLSFTFMSYPALSGDQLTAVKNFLMNKTGKQILYVPEKNEKLIAGIRALSGTLLWEYSISKKLREAQQVMYEQG